MQGATGKQTNMLGLLTVIVLGLAFMAFCYYLLAMHPAKVPPKPVWQ